MYADLLLDHFEHPRNVGEMVDADAEAEVENPVCGDRLHLWLKLDHDVIRAARWRADGCVPAIAAASAMSELIQGLRAEDALALEGDRIAAAIGGVPERKAHALILAQTAVRRALRDRNPR